VSNRLSDVIVIGGGIIGLSLALELRARGAAVRVLERGEPGREASWAGAGMLAAQDPDTPDSLRTLAVASAEIYPRWVAGLEESSGLSADLRSEGTIYLSKAEINGLGHALSPGELEKLEAGIGLQAQHAYFTNEGSVDPRALMIVAAAAAKQSGVIVSHEHPVSSIEVFDRCAKGARVGNQTIAADVIINCAGAWAEPVW
jgi:glycine oxidase